MEAQHPCLERHFGNVGPLKADSDSLPHHLLLNLESRTVPVLLPLIRLSFCDASSTAHRQGLRTGVRWHAGCYSSPSSLRYSRRWAGTSCTPFSPSWLNRPSVPMLRSGCLSTRRRCATPASSFQWSWKPLSSSGCDSVSPRPSTIVCSHCCRTSLTASVCAGPARAADTDRNAGHHPARSPGQRYSLYFCPCSSAPAELLSRDRSCCFLFTCSMEIGVTRVRTCIASR